jgi:drug/metabolite transporter (DMT)-like permease
MADLRASPTFRRTFLILLAGTASIGLSPIFMRLSELEPTATAFYRVFLALPPLWLWAMVERRLQSAPPEPANWKDIGLLALTGLAYGGDLAFWHWSVRYTTVANAILLSNLTPILVTVASFFLFGERFSRLFILGVVLGVGGAAILVMQSTSLGGHSVLGDAFGLITAFFYTAYLMAAARVRARQSTAVVIGWSSLVAALPLLLLAWAMGEDFVAETWRGWLILLGLGVICQAAGQGMIVHALAHLPAAFASIVLLLQPAIAIALAWALLDEPLRPLQSLGVAVIVAGIVCARLGGATKKPV